MRKLLISYSIIIGMILLAGNIKSQTSIVGHNGGTGDWLGWSGVTTIPLDIMHNGNQPINFYTGTASSALKASITWGNVLTNGTMTGDGIRIYDPQYQTGGTGHLDLFTSTSQSTHIKFDGSGLVEGQNNRFEMTGNYNGLWFTAHQTYIPGVGWGAPNSYDGFYIRGNVPCDFFSKTRPNGMTIYGELHTDLLNKGLTEYDPY